MATEKMEAGPHGGPAPGGQPTPPLSLRSIIGAHWRGEYAPYSTSQGAVIGATLMALMVIHLTVPYPMAFRAGPQVALLVARVLVVFIPVYGWLLVGLWRSGANYARRRAAAGESTRYGREIQVGVVVIALLLAWDFVTHFPMLYSLNVMFLYLI